MRIAALLLSGLAAYDWLLMTARLYRLSCVLLALGVAATFIRWFARREPAVLRFCRRVAPWALAVPLLIFIILQTQTWVRESSELRNLPQAAAGSPNVLVVVVDTLRADHLSAYGYPRNTSPHIDALAREGVLFENAISASSWSLPSHVSLLTGRYVFEHGLGDVDVRSFGSGLHALGGWTTLGEVLGESGYRSGAFSGNRTYFTANLGFGRSFIHFEDYFHSPADMFIRTVLGREISRHYLTRSEKSIFTRGLRYLGWDVLLDPDSEGTRDNGASQGIRKRGNYVTQEFLNWIDRTGGKHPFFAFLNYMDVHALYGGPRGFAKPWPEKTPADQYDNGITYVDNEIGRLMSELEKRGLKNDTLVVLTSDHGEGLFQHEVATHGHALYREVIHVPYIVWYPGHVPAGTRVSTTVTNASLPATVVSLIGGSERASVFPQSSVSGLWQSASPGSEWPAAVSELDLRRWNNQEDQRISHLVPTGTTGPMKSLTVDGWHLIVHKTLGLQLFDWKNDPDEMHNLILTPTGQTIASRMMSQLDDVLAGAPAPSLPSAGAVALQDAAWRHATTAQGKFTAAPVNDYYRLRAAPGSTVTVEVHARRLEPASDVDSVIAIEDGQGRPLRTCRNPEDDHTQPPGVPDPTRDAYDDICINDDIEADVNTDSHLELQVPGDASAPVELFVRVSDWNGRVVAGNYQITVTRATAVKTGQ
jgi:arylsulfatase A-like enzyme